MSLNLVKYPVTTTSQINNLFAGFLPVNLEYKREDAQIVSVGAGANGKIQVVISGDITASLNVNEWVYLYAKGNLFDYDNSYQVIDISYSNPNTFITLDSDFIENASIGYLNYKQNYFVEAKLVNPTNEKVMAYSDVLEINGSASGDVVINANALVDGLTDTISESSQEITSARNICKVAYREVWRENQINTFTVQFGEPLVIVYAAENIETEKFINNQNEPTIFAGYEFIINSAHTNENNTGQKIGVSFDELDINKANITTDNALSEFESKDFGILQANFSENIIAINGNTQFIKFNLITTAKPDYKAGDYKAGDYKTTV